MVEECVPSLLEKTTTYKCAPKDHPDVLKTCENAAKTTKQPSKTLYSRSFPIVRIVAKEIRTTMVVICLGPVCIPIWAVLPVVLAFIGKVKTYFMAWWTGKSVQELSKVTPATKPPAGACCKDGVCSLPAEQIETDGKVVVLTSKAEWDKQLSDNKSNGSALFVDFTAEW